MTRFRTKLPNIFIYGCLFFVVLLYLFSCSNLCCRLIVSSDNACNAHLYGMAREPEIFQDVKFVIDRLHASGHCKCARSFHPDAHSVLLQTETNNNSQLCEQLNKIMKPVTSQVRHMNQFNAMIHLLYFLYARYEKGGIDSVCK